MNTAGWVTLVVDGVAIAYCVCFIRSIILLRRRAPFIPTRKAIAREVAARIGVLPAKAVFYDLGCGDGRILSEVARRNPGARFVGIEAQRFPYLMARIFSREVNMRLVKGDFFAQDLSPATHLYLYLSDRVLDELLPKLQKELRPGTLLYALDFTFKDRAPVEVITLSSGRKRKLGKELRIYRF